jgi:hypothetical protein
VTLELARIYDKGSLWFRAVELTELNSAADSFFGEDAKAWLGYYSVAGPNGVTYMAVEEHPLK